MGVVQQRECQANKTGRCRATDVCHVMASPTVAGPFPVIFFFAE